MKNKFLWAAIAVVLLVSSVSFLSARMDPRAEEEAGCQTDCNPSVTITGSFAFGANTRIFTTGSSRNHPCTIVDYVWTVPTATSTPTIVEGAGGGQAKITLNSPPYNNQTVCVTFIVQNASGQQCSAQHCMMGVNF